MPKYDYQCALILVRSTKTIPASALQDPIGYTDQVLDEVCTSEYATAFTFEYGEMEMGQHDL